MAENQNINTVETVIQLRNDSKANWETDAGKGTTLYAGEVAVEINGNKAKLKVGTTDGQTFENAPYIGGEDAQVFQSEILTSAADQDDEVIIGTLVTGAELHAGDIAIIKRYINGTSGAVSYTSYVYEPDVAEGESNWIAMDGNYSASNVFLKNGITLAGDFTSVGNYEKGKTTIAAGTSIESLLSGMLQQELEPTKTSSPSASISASGGSGEVGTTFNAPIAKLTIGGIGSYTYGPATGITFAAGDVKLAEGADPSSATNYKTNASAMVKDSNISLTATNGGMYGDTAIKYTFSGTASYTVPAEGHVPVTNLGNERPGVKFTSGSVTIADKEISFSGYRYAFAGGTTSSTLDSATIRSATAKKNSKASMDTQGEALEFTAAKGATKVFFAYPSTWTGTPYFEMFGLAWAQNTDIVAKDNVQVADARGTNGDGTLNGATAYKLYAWELDTPLQAESTKFRVWFK